MSASSSESTKEESKDYYVSYTVRDVLLYATAIGFGAEASHYETDLPFLWEDSPNFLVFCTWATTLPFWAQQQQQQHRVTSYSGTTSSALLLPPFPPPSMKQSGILPLSCLRDASVYQSLTKDYPILHTRQVITWNQPLSVPCPTASYRLSNRWIAVQPKSIGTFGTTQVDLFDPTTAITDNAPACTLQSTTLVLGLDPDLVNPWQDTSGTPILRSPYPIPRDLYTTSLPTYTETVVIHSNQALLYRLASGDTNAIHVNPDSAIFLGGSDDKSIKSACILHGLATLGVAARVIQQQRCRDAAVGWRHLEANFTHPVHTGDIIEVQLWQNISPQAKQLNGIVVCFRVVVTASAKVAVDRGVAVLCYAQKQPPSKL